MRLATFATVPVKRVCIAVNPLSNGDCATASARKRINRVKRVKLGRIRRKLRLKTACNRGLGMSVAIIGTSSGPWRAAICRERRPNPAPTSNNLLELRDNFLDVVEKWFRF
jgi:hypothetical protein